MTVHAVRYYCEPQIMFGVGRDSFLPPPKVDSAVIRLNVGKRANLAVSDERAFFRLIKAAFSMRRKTLSNALSSSLGFGGHNACLAFRKWED